MKSNITKSQFVQIMLSQLFALVSGACLFAVIAAPTGWNGTVPLTFLSISILINSIAIWPKNIG